MRTRNPSRWLVTGARRSGPLVLLSLLIATGTLLADPVSEKEVFLPVEEIRPGMIGVGRTVFQGHVPEEYQVEILGVLQNALAPQRDLIVSRLRGTNVERTGVISGMSGSPVTIDGRLIGAISYRLGIFEKEPIAGITPIADMLQVSGTETAAVERSATSLLARWAALEEIEPGTRSPSAHTTGTEEFQPITIPLVYGGIPKSVIQRALPIFQSLGLQPLQGGGSGQGGQEYPIRPGAPVALELVRGDFNLSSVGTVTHVRGKQVWAFGHPFLGTGPTRLPMSRAEVVAIYPSQLSSFMIASPTSFLGTLLQDRLTAVQGVIGPAPERIPVEVALDYPGNRRKFSFEMCQSPMLTPVLLALTLQASLQQSQEYTTGATYRGRLSIETEDHPLVRYDLVEAGAGRGPGMEVVAMAGEAAGIFNAVFNNRFESPKIRSVRLDVTRVPGDRVARIQNLSLRPAEVNAGEEVTVRVSLHPYRGQPVLREMRVTVPPETPAGPIGIVVSSAREMAAQQRNLLQRRFSGLSDLDGLIEFINELRRDDTLYLQLVRPQSGALVGGEVLPALPLSIISALRSHRFAGGEQLISNLPLVEVGSHTDFVLVGGRRGEVQVR